MNTDMTSGTPSYSCDACRSWSATPLKRQSTGEQYGCACDRCFRKWADPVNDSYLDSWPQFVAKARARVAVIEPKFVLFYDPYPAPNNTLTAQDPKEIAAADPDWLEVWNFAKSRFPKDFHYGVTPTKGQLEYVALSWHGKIRGRGWYKEVVKPLWDARNTDDKNKPC